MDLDLDSFIRKLGLHLEQYRSRQSHVECRLMRSPYENVTIRYRNVTIDESSELSDLTSMLLTHPMNPCIIQTILSCRVLHRCVTGYSCGSVYNKGIQSVEGNDDGDQPTTDDLRNLLTNDPYTRKVAAFLTPDYFEGTYQSLLKETLKYIGKFNRLPTLEAFKIEIDENDRLPDEQYRHAMEILPDIFTHADEDMDWLVEKTEKFCQDRAVFNAVMESISIIDGKHQTLSKNAIPDVLTKHCPYRSIRTSVTTTLRTLTHDSTSIT